MGEQVDAAVLCFLSENERSEFEVRKQVHFTLLCKVIVLQYTLLNKSKARLK